MRSSPLRRIRVIPTALVVSAALLAFGGCSDNKTPLIERINAYRSAPDKCKGQLARAVGPLAHSPVLARIELPTSSGSLMEILKRVDYSAAGAQVVVLSGPSTSGSAMAVLKERYCDVLLSSQFSEIGIGREGSTWRIVLAQPLIPADLGGWAYAGKQVLDLVNVARAQPRTCGDTRFDRAPPLQWNERLGTASVAHSRDMAKGNYFAHAGKDGTMVGDRAAREGYEWQRIGENIAAGQGSADQVVASWLASPTHCRNIMQAEFTDMGAAYFVNPASETVIYWTQVFGTPQR